MQVIRNIPEFRKDPVVVLILGFITCGLYLIYWNIKVAQVFNAVAEREVISPLVAVLCGCIYPINIYFYYLVGNEGLPKLYEYIEEPPKDQAVLLLILGIFFPMIAAMIVQGEVNKLYDGQRG